MAHINSSQWQRESATLCFTKGKETVTCCCICHCTLKNGETGLGREAQALKIENEIGRGHLTQAEVTALTKDRSPPLACPECYKIYTANPEKAFWRYLTADKWKLVRFLYVQRRFAPPHYI
jgi:hypothetical protein